MENGRQLLLGEAALTRCRVAPRIWICAGCDRQGMVPDMLVMGFTHRSAHMVLRIGFATIRTCDRGGVLLLPKVLDIGDVRALIGSPLERLVEHPATVRGEYVIRSVVPEAPRGRTVVEFAVAPIEWRLPWGRPPTAEPF